MYALPMSLPEKLKLIKQLTGESQEKLAAKLGVSFATLNSWINGKSIPRKRAQTQIDELYARLTGQRLVPKSALIAKKQMIDKNKSESKDPLKIILGRKDLYDELMLSLTYNTNRIEGSSLTEDETADILFESKTLANKSLMEQMEVKNHQASLTYLLHYLAENQELDEALILKLHSMLMNGIRDDAGTYRRHGVRIVGSNVPTANHLKVPVLMKELVKEIRKSPKDFMAHVAAIHSQFEKIHPFSDGNGRIGRLVLQAMLLKDNLASALIMQKKRSEYMASLNKSQIQEDFSLLEDFFCDAVLEGYKMLKEQ